MRDDGLQIDHILRTHTFNVFFGNIMYVSASVPILHGEDMQAIVVL